MNNTTLSKNESIADLTATVGIYERTRDFQAWMFVRESTRTAAELARDVNSGFGVETLIVPPIRGSYPQFLDCFTNQN